MRETAKKILHDLKLGTTYRPKLAETQFLDNFSGRSPASSNRKWGIGLLHKQCRCVRNGRWRWPLRYNDGYRPRKQCSLWGDCNPCDSGNGFVGLAGYFTGDVNVTAGTKDFRIDHPLDPASKYLLHASVECSGMMDIYTGNINLGPNGDAVVQLPDWFEAMNGDFRYQLTSIGAPGTGLHVAQEISGHRFTIAGGKAGAKVSWQVTAVRHDAFAKAHPLMVEQAKVQERGYYIHPELYGAPHEKGIDWALHPALMRGLQQRRTKAIARLNSVGTQYDRSTSQDAKPH